MKSTTWLFASFIFIVLLGVSSIGVAQVDTWTQVADIPTTGIYQVAAALDGKIYVIGGWSGGSLSTVEVYDPVTDTWTPKADMPTARFGASANVVDGKIYVIGGYAGGGPLSIVEVYDPATDTWATRGGMPTARSLFASGVVNGKIYAIGGSVRTFATAGLSTVEVYDPVADAWTTKADMPTPREAKGSVVDGKIYVIGGFGSVGPPTSVVEMYNPATDTWSPKSNIPTARLQLYTSVVNRKVYAIGGATTGYVKTLSALEEYDTVTDTWTKKPGIPTARWALTTSAVNGFIYVIGGGVGPGVPELLSTVEAYDTGVGIRIQAISPLEGSPAGGEPIAMSGTGFPPDVIVTIGGKPLIDQEIINDTVISGLTPPQPAGEYDLVISSPSAPMSDLFYRTTFLYPSPFPPTITAITPNRGPLTGGQVATIEGNGFIPGVSVVISDVEAKVIAFTETHITFTTPAHTEGAKFVLVRNVDRKVGFLDGGYTYIDVEFPPEDLNLDGVVNLFDLVRVASQFGQVEANLSGDVNGDGTVNLFDLVLVASHFGETAVGAAPPGVEVALNQSPERVRQALAQLETMGERSPGVEMAIDFLRGWLANPPVTETKLLPNYPNPFNPETWIPYQLATDADVQVRIYDISGTLVRQLGIGHQQGGSYVNRERAAYWNGRDENGEQVSSGLYFYQLRAGDYSATKRMVIVK